MRIICQYKPFEQEMQREKTKGNRKTNNFVRTILRSCSINITEIQRRMKTAEEMFEIKEWWKSFKINDRYQRKGYQAVQILNIYI